jgi:hypothetical protein
MSVYVNFRKHFIGVRRSQTKSLEKFTCVYGIQTFGCECKFLPIFVLGIANMIKSFGQFYIHTRGFDSHTDTLRKIVLLNNPRTLSYWVHNENIQSSIKECLILQHHHADIK